MLSINAKTSLLGLIGNPVGHSISPLIHNTLSDRLGHNNAYLAFKVEQDDLCDAIKGAYALGVKGLNVTVPHKQAVIEHLVDIDPLAKAIGAVNTLVRVDGGFKGYNTDYLGLRRQMENDGVLIEGQEIIILGAGGASRAITFMCAEARAKKIYLLNRSVEKAVSLARDVNDYINCEQPVVIPMALTDYAKLSGRKYTVIQTTSKGLFPDVDGAPVEDEAFYELVSDAVDIIFNPYETKFMKLAAKHGARTYNGLGMLLYQGVAAYELWNDTSVDQKLCEEVYELMKREMGH